MLKKNANHMTFNIKNTIRKAILASIALTVGSIPATAQSRSLPAAHERQHRHMMTQSAEIAVNTPANAQAVKAATAADILDREALDEIYNNYWNSTSVNPYGDVAIPATKNINVAEGVVPVTGRVTSDYGWRARFGRMHRGVDLALKVGDTVRVAFSGKVRLVKNEPGGYGNYVVVRHDNGMETVYGHLSRFLCKPNQRVEAGEPIALGGNTGRSTGPHLHFETRYMGLAVNPALIFDFEHNTTIKDVYTFDKASYERAQVGSRKSTASASKKKATTRKAATKKKTTTKKKSRRR